MTVTDSDIEPDRQGSGNAVEVEDDRDFHNARARDGQRTSFGDTLPDTQRVQDAFADWWNAVRDLTTRLGDGSFWDEQPPSPRELVERHRESSWTHSDYKAVRVLRWLGMAVSIAWSVPLYGLAILGQRFGRALVAALFTYLFIHLI